MKPKPVAIILSCEHAVNDIPTEFNHYFTTHQALLKTHRGYDLGTAAIVERLAQSLNCYHICATSSRLLIDVNRSINHPSCFSEISSHFSPIEKQYLIEHYYQPFRQQIIRQIESHVANGYQVWHLSMHSFTPVLNGAVRQAELGLLYDPKRPSEKRMVQAWQKLLKYHCKEWRIRLNYPYKGTDDGFTSSLRCQFADNDYLGIEIECNQALTDNAPTLTHTIELLELTLKILLRPNAA